MKKLNHIKKCIKTLDIFLGEEFNLSSTNYIKPVDEISKRHKEKISEEEWTELRVLDKLPNQSYLKSWLALLTTREKRMFYLFDEMSEIINKYSSIIEFGSGQGHIGTLLNLSGMKVKMTEFKTNNNFLINNIEGLPSIDQEDILNISPNKLKDYSLAFAVQVDYIFENYEIFDFLLKAYKSDTDVLIVNSQIFGIFNYFNYKLKDSYRRKNLKKHGTRRTIGFYKKLAKKIGYKFKYLKGKTEKTESYYMFHFKKTS